jgi:acetaldehyde dehydrogenase (acetylating)
LRRSRSNNGKAAVQYKDALASIAGKSLEPSVRAAITDAFKKNEKI